MDTWDDIVTWGTALVPRGARPWILLASSLLLVSYGASILAMIAICFLIFQLVRPGI